MVEKTTIGGGLLAIAVAAGVAFVGTQQPWWCKYFGCSNAATALNVTPTPSSSTPPIAIPSTPPQILSYMGPIEQGKNRDGSDLGPSQRVSNAEACRSLCAAQSECQAMTFVTDSSDPAGGICWLKNAVPAATPNDNMASAVKQYGNP